MFDSAWCSNLGVKQLPRTREVLMHEKSCVIPIIIDMD